MSINFYESTPKGISEDLREKYNESWGEPNRHKFFTEDELNQLLNLCDLSESGADLRHGVDGFSLVSDDRNAIESMIEAKKIKQKLPQMVATEFVVREKKSDKPQKVYVVVDRQQPNAPIGVFEDIKQAKEAAKLFRFQKDACKYRKGMDNWPWIWEIGFDTPFFDRLPREICY